MKLKCCETLVVTSTSSFFIENHPSLRIQLWLRVVQVFLDRPETLVASFLWLSSSCSDLSLRQVQPVALIWQLITDSSTANLLVKLFKCSCIYNLFSQIRNSSQGGSGQMPPLHSTKGPGPKLLKYLFIYSTSR